MEKRDGPDFNEVRRWALDGQVGRLVALPECRRVQVPPEILAVAEEFAASSDVLGIETSNLEELLRAVLYLAQASPSQRA